MPCNDPEVYINRYLRKKMGLGYTDTPEKFMGNSYPENHEEMYECMINELTQFLCFTLTEVQSSSPSLLKDITKKNNNLGKWWKAHQKWDKKEVVE